MRFLNLLAAALLGSCASAPQPKAVGVWIELFDGASLTGWRQSDFGNASKVAVEGGRIHIHPGNPMAGVTYLGEVPKAEYEVEVHAARTKGEDFFCCLTLPIGESHCSLVVGGWGGKLVGLSSIDGMDASENSTSTFHDFVDDRVYRIRVRIADRRVQAFLDDKRVVDHPTVDHDFSLRWEVEDCRPLGIATYRTQSAIHKVRYRRLR